MNFDPFTYEPIHLGEIWTQSKCLSNENNTYDAIFQNLELHGWRRIDSKILVRDRQKLVVCLVDDIISQSGNYHKDLPYIFNSSTQVITDNYITCPSMYKIHRLPNSFFGIYSYTPDIIWQPDRDFTFSVNRIDSRRTQLMLELAWRTHLHHGYVNFNCQQFFSKEHPQTAGFAKTVDPTELAKNYLDFWQKFLPETQAKYQRAHELIVDQMPIKNYEQTFEHVQYHSWVNMIIETYSSDNNIALSEKIFRALVTPAPWIVYSGRYTVAFLESLGFDCLGDLIDHNHYDRLKTVEDRIRIFIWFGLKTVKELKQQSFVHLQQRCQQAANHNQQLLANMRKQWPEDFKSWIESLPNLLVP